MNILLPILIISFMYCVLLKKKNSSITSLLIWSHDVLPTRWCYRHIQHSMEYLYTITNLLALTPSLPGQGHTQCQDKKKYKNSKVIQISWWTLGTFKKTGNSIQDISGPNCNLILCCMREVSSTIGTEKVEIWTILLSQGAEKKNNF